MEVEEFAYKILQVAKDRYEVDLIEPIHGVRTVLECTCVICGQKWKASFRNLIDHNSGCPYCWKAKKKEMLEQKTDHPDYVNFIVAVNKSNYHYNPDGQRAFMRERYRRIKASKLKENQDILS